MASDDSQQAQKQVSDRNNLKEIETMVRYIMSMYPETCNNDLKLYLRYWDMVNLIKIPSHIWVDFIENATMPELISRMRRKIQHDAQEGSKYAAREDIRKGRLEKAERFRKMFGGAKQGGKRLDEFK